MPEAVEAQSFASLEDGWQELLSVSPNSAIFITPAWARAWWQEFGQGKELLLLAVECDESLLGIAPLMVHGDTISLVGSPDLCDYLDFIPRSGQEETFYSVVWEKLTGHSWKVLDLRSLAADSPTLVALPERAERVGCVVEKHLEDVCPKVELPHTWELYLACLGKKDRHELRRKLHRLAEKGFSYYATRAPVASERDIDDFLRLFVKSGPRKAQFMTEGRARFFRSLLNGVLWPDIFKLYFLEMEGVRVSTALCFDYRRQRLLYSSGYDPDYSYWSVGLILKALCIKDAIAMEMRQMDFLRGAEHYKQHLGARAQPIYRLVIKRNK